MFYCCGSQLLFLTLLLLLSQLCLTPLLCLALMLVLSKPILEDPLVLLIVIIICFISNTTEFHETPDRIVLVFKR